MKIVLTEINEGHHFTDCTSFFGAKMYDTHAMEETAEGLKLINKLVVTGPLKRAVKKNQRYCLLGTVNKLIF